MVEPIRVRVPRVGLWVLGIIVLLGSGARAADGQGEDPLQTAWEETDEEAPMVDQLHEILSRNLLRAIESLDRRLARTITPMEDRRSETFDHFFGDRRLRADQEVGKSTLRVAPRTTFSRNENFQTGVDFSGRISLPRTEDRLQLIIDNVTGEQDRVESDERFRRLRSRREEDRTSAFLRIQALERMNLSLNFDAGLQFRPEPVPRIRLRARTSWTSEFWRYSLTQTGFWQSDDGFGERTSFEVQRPIGSDHLFEANSTVLWSEASQGVQTGQTFSLYRFLSERRSIGILAGGFARVEPTTRMETYLFRVPYRQRIWRDWMYLKVEPGFNLEREYNFTFDPLVMIQVEFVLGRAERE